MRYATNSQNFYVGRSADVGNMLLHEQIVSVLRPDFFLSARKTKYQYLLCEWRLGEGLGEVLFETMSRHSVLSAFSLSLFDVIHVFTSEMQSCMPWTEVFI